MSYLQVTAVRASVGGSDQFNTVRGSAIQCIAPVSMLNVHNNNVLKANIGSSKRCTELIKCNIMRKIGVSRYQRCAPVCSFGGKGDSKNGDEGSPWKSIEKAMSSFKKEKSLEDVLRQQMEKQEYYDGDPPSGGGGGGGGGGGFGGFGETEDEGFAGMFDEILQVALAMSALIVLYLYIITGDQVKIFITGTLKFLLGKKGPRIRLIMYEFAQFYQKFRANVPYDPYWLEKQIILTPTWWDSPQKYRRVLNIPERSIKSSKRNKYTESDEAYGDYGDDDSDNDNDYSKKSSNDDDNDNDEDDNDYSKKASNDDDNDEDDNDYSEDIDDDF